MCLVARRGDREPVPGVDLDEVDELAADAQAEGKKVPGERGGPLGQLVPSYRAETPRGWRLRATTLTRVAGRKSFQRKDTPATPPEGPGNPTLAFHGGRRSNATHASANDPEGRWRGGQEPSSPISGHVPMENRNGLAGGACVTQAADRLGRRAGWNLGPGATGGGPRWCSLEFMRSSDRCGADGRQSIVTRWRRGSGKSCARTSCTAEHRQRLRKQLQGRLVFRRTVWQQSTCTSRNAVVT